VGLSGLLLDFGITLLLKEKLNTHKYFANAMGFTVAAFSNFYWNKIWTFEDTNTQVGMQLTSFLIIAVIGLLLNTVFLILFEKKMQLPFYMAKALAIAVVIVWNFTMNYLITFV